MIAYLEAENAYTDGVMGHTDKLQERLFREITGRIKKDDSTVPSRDGEYFHYIRYEGKGEYPIYARKRGSLDAPEEILLDANERAKGHEFYSSRGVRTSSGDE